MNSSQKESLILSLYKSSDMVFTLQVALLTGETNFKLLNQRLNYHVHTGKLLRPRRGYMPSPVFKSRSCASFIHLLIFQWNMCFRESRIVFQYDSRISAVSYLSRSIVVDNKTIAYRKIKMKY
jgi:hypothetical protein